MSTSSSFGRVSTSSSTNPWVASSSPIAMNQTALERSIARVKLVVEKVQLEILSERLSKLNCSITLDFPKDPVVTNCGHLFDRMAINQWTSKNDYCPLCKTRTTQTTPIHGLREFIAERLPNPIPTCSKFQGLKPESAARWLKFAQTCIQEKNDVEALEAYDKALQYTQASSDYAAIPEIYDRLKEPEKAALSRLYLTLYQLQEKRVQEAIETLKSCHLDTLNVSSLVIGLKLLLCPSFENIEQTMEEAFDQKNLDDSIFIYKQILEFAPDRLDVYQRLISLTKDPEEKKELLLKAAELAHVEELLDLEKQLRMEAKTLIISKKEETTAQITLSRSYPLELKEVLAEDDVRKRMLSSFYFHR